MCYTSFPNNLQALEHLHTYSVGFIIGVICLTGVFLPSLPASISLRYVQICVP